MCDEIAMLKGEKRKIRLYVHSRKNDVFVIRNAYVEILQYGELVKTIECMIDEHDLTFMLALDEEGSYSMLAVYEIADEIIKNKLQNNWNDIVYKRGYLAIIEGKLKKKHGTIKNHLDESKTQMVYIANNGKGKLAITNYKVLKESRYNSLIEVFLETGRKNQIRVHMQSLGHSIVGDKKYGATTNPIKRMGLHSHVFAFVHPDTKARMEFKAVVPEEFKKMFK